MARGSHGQAWVDIWWRARRGFHPAHCTLYAEEPFDERERQEDNVEREGQREPVEELEAEAQSLCAAMCRVQKRESARGGGRPARLPIQFVAEVV